MIRLYIYIHSFSYSFPLWFIIGYSRTLLFIHPIYNSLLPFTLYYINPHPHLSILNFSGGALSFFHFSQMPHLRVIHCSQINYKSCLFTKGSGQTLEAFHNNSLTSKGKHTDSENPCHLHFAGACEYDSKT